jgi:hypothetical protein
MLAEQAALLSHRLDTLLAEADRLESELLAEGNDITARDIACFALELRLARRSLAALLPTFDPTTPRTLALVGRNDLTAPRAGPA